MIQGIAELRHFLGLDRMSLEELEEVRDLLDERGEPSRLGLQPNKGQ